jgi:hypothetical protein
MNHTLKQLNKIGTIKKIENGHLEVFTSNERRDFQKGDNQYRKLINELSPISYLFSKFTGPWTKASNLVLSEKPDAVIILDNNEKISIEITSISVQCCYVLGPQGKFMKEQANIQHIFDISPNETISFQVKYKTPYTYMELLEDLINSIEKKSKKLPSYLSKNFKANWLLVHRPHNCREGWNKHFFAEIENLADQRMLDLKNFDAVLVLDPDNTLVYACKDENTVKTIFLDSNNTPYSPKKRVEEDAKLIKKINAEIIKKTKQAIFMDR